MANDRLNYQAPFVTVEPFAQVNVETGAGQYMRTLSNVFLTNAGEAHKRQLASDLELAKVEGGRVGYDNGAKFQPMRADSMFARQYNDSGITTAMENIQMSTQKSYKGFYEKNKMNPTELSKTLDSYSKGYVSKLAPEMQTAVKMQLDKLGASLVTQAGDNLKAYNRQVAAARFSAYERTMENTLEVVAPSVFEGGEVGTKAQESVAQLRQNYIDTLAQHGPRGKYNAGGYTVDGSKTGSGAMNPTEISAKLREFDMKVVEAGVYGHFVKEAEAGRGVDAYMNFVKGNVEITAVDQDGKPKSMKISDFLLNDEMEKMASKMRVYSSGVDSMEEAVSRKWNRQQDRASDAIKRAGFQAAFDIAPMPDGSQRIVGGDPIKLQGLIAEAMQNPMVKPEAIKELQDLAEKIGNGSVDNPMTATEARVAVSQGTISSYKDLPATGLSDKTRIELHNQIDQRLKGEDWSSSVRYRQSTDYAEAVLAPAKSAGFNIFGDDAATKASAADMAEWRRRMISDAWAAQDSGLMPANPNGIPGKMQDGRAQFDFVQHGRALADEIAARRTKPAAVPPEVQEIDTKIKAVQAKMDAPKPGDDTKAVADEYRKLMSEKAALQAKGQ